MIRAIVSVSVVQRKGPDTVDLGIADHLVPEMQRTDWDVIIAHTLGIDHVAIVSPLHPIMGEKLVERTSSLRS